MWIILNHARSKTKRLLSLPGYVINRPDGVHAEAQGHWPATFVMINYFQERYLVRRQPLRSIFKNWTLSVTILACNAPLFIYTRGITGINYSCHSALAHNNKIDCPHGPVVEPNNGAPKAVPRYDILVRLLYPA